jgi:hypothetical protein
MWTPRRLKSLARFLYTHNPFYAISASLILYGLYLVFCAEDGALEHPWRLALALCGYTSVMAVTAFLVVKLGKVWEDARSLVLILLLQFAAISMSFDQLCSTAPTMAAGLLAFGLGFSVLVTEALLGGLRIRFPLGFRLPYYLLLGLFFGYPLLVAPREFEGSVGLMAWRVYLFPVAAGLVFLTLLPAARRGAWYVAGNGTPWRWPWFPWPAFAFLALAAGVRSYVLTYNFNLMGAGDAFGGYYLMPLLLALLVVVLELAVTARCRWLETATLAAAPLLLVLSVPRGDNEIYLRFLTRFQETVGSPIWLTVLALIAFYGYAWLRRLRGAEWSLLTTVALLTVIGRQTTDLHTLAPAAWWPWCVLAGWQLLQAVAKRSSQRCAWATLCAVVAASLAWHDAPLLIRYGILPGHILLAGSLVIGLVFRDRFARLLQRLGLALVIAGMVAAVVAIGGELLPTAALCEYLVALAVVAWLYWWTTRDRWWFCAGVLQAAVLSGTGVWVARTPLAAILGPDAVTPLSGGVASFLVAVLISAWKGGLGRPLRRRLAALGLVRVNPDVPPA